MRKGTKIDYSKKLEIAKKITELYKIGTYTIESVCKSNGIDYSTFYNWVNEYPEIRDIYNIAKQKNINFFKEMLRPKALSSLEKRIKGYKYTEEKIVTVPILDEKGKKIGETIKEIVKTKKFIPPDPSLTKFAIANIIPEDFKEKTNLEIDGNLESNVNVNHTEIIDRLNKLNQQK